MSASELAALLAGPAWMQTEPMPEDEQVPMCPTAWRIRLDEWYGQPEPQATKGREHLNLHAARCKACQLWEVDLNRWAMRSGAWPAADWAEWEKANA